MGPKDDIHRFELCKITELLTLNPNGAVKASRTTRLVAVIFAVIRLLFTQLALAAFCCPGTAIPETKYTFRYFQDVEKSVTDPILWLVSVLSVYEITMREFEVFRSQFSRQMESFQKDISSFALEASAYSRGEGFGPLKWPPTDADLQKLDEMAKAAIASATGLTGTVEDLRVESQNILIGGLFPGQKAKPRRPGDPNVKVVTAEFSQE